MRVIDLPGTRKQGESWQERLDRFNSEFALKLKREGLNLSEREPRRMLPVSTIKSIKQGSKAWTILYTINEATVSMEISAVLARELLEADLVGIPLRGEYRLIVSTHMVVDTIRLIT